MPAMLSPINTYGGTVGVEKFSTGGVSSPGRFVGLLAKLWPLLQVQ